MKFCLIVALWIVQLPLAFAQEKQYDGIVFDRDSKERIAKVNIQNTSSGANNYDNLKAEFKINAKAGDVIIFSKFGYFSDTLRLGAETTLAVYLKPTSIPLKEVTIRDNLDPEKRYEATRREYDRVYGTLANRDLLSIGGGNGVGVGLSIDALYNMLSFRGRNAARLRATIQRDYEQNVIDARFNKTLVESVTGLKDFSLMDFMFKYRPTYYFVVQSNEYDFIRYIKSSYERYKFNPNVYTLPPLSAQP